jgi:transcriptional regulator with XRE-family HTH domain
MNGNELKKLFGEKVKFYRLKQKLSQEELSVEIDRTQRQISLIELGKSFPTPETMTLLAAALKCDINNFFEFGNHKTTEEMKIELHQIINTLSNEKIKSLYIASKSIE